jgi:hypothetical protein
MSNLIMIEMKPSQNKKINNFFQKINQYLESEGFSIVDDTINGRIIYILMNSIPQTKSTGFINTIKNTTDYALSVKAIYTTTNLTKK